MKLYRAYVRFLNFAVRLFGALALLVGIVSLGCAYAFTEYRGTRVVAGIFLATMGVAVFLARPITLGHITRMRQRMGRIEWVLIALRPTLATGRLGTESTSPAACDHPT
jgi:hypothetical protein